MERDKKHVFCGRAKSKMCKNNRYWKPEKKVI